MSARQEQPLYVVTVADAVAQLAGGCDRLGTVLSLTHGVLDDIPCLRGVGHTDDHVSLLPWGEFCRWTNHLSEGLADD